MKNNLRKLIWASLGLHRSPDTLGLSEDVLATFQAVPYRPATMTDTSYLRAASMDEIATALAFALQFHGRKRVHHADDMRARITADHPVRHLEASGFVLMKAPPAASPRTSNMPTPTNG
jgi:hypothetical protein